MTRSSSVAARFDAVQQTPILNDLGSEKRSEWTDETLFKLLDYRYREESPPAVASKPHPRRSGAAHRLPAAGSHALADDRPRRSAEWDVDGS
ncbi:MAG TPA: hypothetical protein VF792_03040 [Ktedonobacterales bacterium]